MNRHISTLLQCITHYYVEGIITQMARLRIETFLIFSSAPPITIDDIIIQMVLRPARLWIGTFLLFSSASLISTLRGLLFDGSVRLWIDIFPLEFYWKLSNVELQASQSFWSWHHLPKIDNRITASIDKIYPLFNLCSWTNGLLYALDLLHGTKG